MTPFHVRLFQVLLRNQDDYAEFKCKARNNLGHREQTIYLKEGKKPEAPKEFFLRGFNSDTFHVDVGAKVDPKNRHPMEIKGYRFEVITKDAFKNNHSWKKSWVKDFSIADGATYLLSPLSENTTYLVRVASRNVAGLSDWTEVAEFTTLPKLPFIPSMANRLLSKVSSFGCVTIYLVAMKINI